MPRGIRNRVVEATTQPDQTSAPVLTQPVSRRAAETRRERRRRNDGDLDRNASMKLAIPKEIQERAKAEGKVMRWIMDTRMHEAHQDDWDRVEGVEPIQANPREGTEERLVLCSKYADWHEADQRADAHVIDEHEQALMRGHVNGEGRTSAGLTVPEGQTNSVTTKRGL